MKRTNLNEGTRDEILAELDTYGRDRLQQGKPEKAQAFAHAFAVIEGGGEEVHVGHSIYRVCENPAT